MTVLLLVGAIGFSISSIISVNKLGPSGTLRTWLFILLLGATYFALEEISYGQHMFGWGTAETWKELNNQGETNLHNVPALFDQLPRLLLTLGILISGVIMPLYRYFRKIRPILAAIDTKIINTGEMKENLITLLSCCIAFRSTAESGRK